MTPHDGTPSSSAEEVAVPNHPERIDPADNDRPGTHVEREHIERYLWAADRVGGAVLDAACGTGYGTKILSQRCKAAGIDRDARALARARAREPESEFLTAELPDIPYDDSSFDAAVSFETLEHLTDAQSFLQELMRVIKPGGKLLLSTPNAAVTSPTGIVPNEWHEREFLLQELTDVVLKAGLVDIEVYGQCFGGSDSPAGRLALKFVARFPILCRPGRWWDRLAHGTEHVERPNGRSPKYWVLRCRRRWVEES
jgi:SAM-dependent methyltransferase